jgi:ATP-dependent RNA helicase SUPV3L1/SUV3
MRKNPRIEALALAEIEQAPGDRPESEIEQGHRRGDADDHGERDPGTGGGEGQAPEGGGGGDQRAQVKDHEPGRRDAAGETREEGHADEADQAGGDVGERQDGDGEAVEEEGEGRG